MASRKMLASMDSHPLAEAMSRSQKVAGHAPLSRPPGNTGAAAGRLLLVPKLRKESLNPDRVSLFDRVVQKGLPDTTGHRVNSQ
jgi:hypothetical protein